MRKQKQKTHNMNLTKPVVLIGMMGSGKTKIGHMLAKTLKARFIDSDHRIEESAGCSISDIFEKYGEPEFRRLEKRVIANLIVNNEADVIALGGGAILNEDTAALIKERALCVWVKAPLDHIYKRVSQNSNRPLLACENPREVLQDLMQQREPHYARADLHIDNEDDQAEQAIQKILERIASLSE